MKSHNITLRYRYMIYDTLNLISFYFCLLPRLALNTYNNKFRLFHPFIDNLLFFYSKTQNFQFFFNLCLYKIYFLVQNQMHFQSINCFMFAEISYVVLLVY